AQRAAQFAVKPASAEEQIAALQSAVAELQTKVESLTSQVNTLTPAPGDRYLTIRSPNRGIVCSAFGTLSPNEILGHIKLVNFESFEDDIMIPIWSKCRHQ